MSEEALTGDEKFIKTVGIDGEVVSIQEGTFQEIALPRVKPESNIAPGAMGAAKVDDIIKVAKFAWDIIKDSNAQAATEAATTRVLSPKDDNWVHYAHAQDIPCKEILYKLDNIVGVNCFTVKFRVAGTHRAKHEEIGGLWMPNAHITFSKCSANWPWAINGRVIIDNTNLSNMGSVEEPIPQLVLNVKIKSDAKFGLNWESYEETFEFLLNANDGAKPI